MTRTATREGQGMSRETYQAFKDGKVWKVGTEHRTICYVMAEPQVEDFTEAEARFNARLIANALNQADGKAA